MNATNVLDDYLGELLLDIAPAAPACKPGAVAVAVPAPQAETEAPAEEVMAKTKASEPQQAGPTVVAFAPPPAPAPADIVAAPAAPAPVRESPMPAVAPPPAPILARAAPPPAPRRAPAPATPAPETAAPATAGNNVWAALQAQARGPEQPRHRRASERTSRWLRLRCGAQAYALELLKVQEVVLPVPLLGLRGTGPSMLGIMNLRGQVVPVIDLGLHLDLTPIVEDSQTRIVVLEENGEVLGLRVSAVEDVASLTESQIEPPDTVRICRISNTLFRGVARLGQRPMILLDATQLLSYDR